MLSHIGCTLKHATALGASLCGGEHTHDGDTWDVLPEEVCLQWQPHIVNGDWSP